MSEERHASSDPSEWLDRHGDALFRFAILRVSSRDLAEELVQETFLAAWKGREKFAGRASERTWFVKILRNKIVDHYRRKTREVAATDLSADPDVTNEIFDDRGRWREPPGAWVPDPSSLIENEEFHAVLHTCMADLPERQAAAFTLRVLETKASDSVCKILEVTATNLGVLLHRARIRLRRCLELTWFETGEKEET